MRMTVSKTYSVRPTDIHRRWHVLDAAGQRLGRLASQVARLLRGKHKTIYSSHMPVGDYVIVINARQVQVTGTKMTDKLYRWHTGYPGGFRERSLGQMLKEHPERVVRDAVQGMLPHNALGRQLLGMLKVYPGPEHPHQAQVKAGAMPAVPRPPQKKAVPEKPKTAAAPAAAAPQVRRAGRPTRRAVKTLAERETTARRRRTTQQAAPSAAPSHEPEAEGRES